MHDRALCMLPDVGTYEPLIELASGGMGVVAVARRVGDAGFERLVVTKRVHPHLLADPTFRKMIREEALLLSRVHDAHVVSILDVVETDGELSLVLEYVESLSLSTLLRMAKAGGGRIPLSIAARILTDALAGLHAAHESVDENGNPLGIIHRDVSPQNIVVGFDGSSRLIDFGIAKATTPTEKKEETTDGVIKGKVRYMAPEQMKNQPLDRRTDVFSAGIVLYEAITNERVVRADNDGDILLGMLLGDFDPPTHWVADLPPELAAVTMKALELDRDDRFATAAEFAEALERAVPIAPTREVARFVNEHGGEMISERRARIRSMGRTPATVRPPPPTTVSLPTSVEPVRARSQNRKRMAGLALAFLVVVSISFFGWRLTHEKSAIAPLPSASSIANVPPTVDPSASTSVTPNVPNVDAAPSASSRPTSHAPITGTPTKHGSNHPVRPRASDHTSGCDPPYDVLPDGTHRFKPQCVQ